MAIVVAKKNTGSAKKTTIKFVIDCSRPVNDGIFDLHLFENFLNTHVKVNGKTGSLGGAVAIAREGQKIVFTSTGVHYSKRYMKYLTKKFLKSHQLRDWLHVIASDKSTYQLRYFNINQDETNEDAEDEDNDE